MSNVFFNGPRAGINMNDGFGGEDWPQNFCCVSSKSPCFFGWMSWGHERGLTGIYGIHTGDFGWGRDDFVGNFRKLQLNSGQGSDSQGKPEIVTPFLGKKNTSTSSKIVPICLHNLLNFRNTHITSDSTFRQLVCTFFHFSTLFPDPWKTAQSQCFF